VRRSTIPRSVLEARIMRAHIAQNQPFDVMYRTLEDAWIVVDSSWRAKLGGSTECAVCDKPLKLGRRDLCRRHDRYEFLLVHHSDTPAEQREAAARRLRIIAGLDENYLPTPRERVPLRARLWSLYYRFRP